MMDILIDFDGTVVEHDFPNIGQSVGAEPVLRRLVDEGHRLILFTMRSDVVNPQATDPTILNIPGDYLTQAVRWFEERGIPLYGVNTNPTQHEWTSSPKAYGQLMIDDTAIGIPLVYPEGRRPYVNWVEVERLLELRGFLYPLGLATKKEFTLVAPVKDDSGHWYVIPALMETEFQDDLERMEDEDDEYFDFGAKWGQYMTGGSLSQGPNLYAHI